MNDNLRQLAFQAGFIGESLDTTVFGTCQETALKNFAELIVEQLTKAQCSQDIRTKLGLGE